MRGLRHRKAPLVAIVAAVALGAALVAACAGIFQTALALDAPPQRLARADIVVAASEHARLAEAGGRPAQTVTLSERPGLPAGLREQIAGVPGVARAVQRGPAVEVSARPGADRDALKEQLKDRLPGVAVLTGDDRGRAEETGVAASRLKLILMSSIFGGLALVVMAILLASITSLAIEQRHRELALLRTIGATPRQVRRLVVRQTMRPAFLAAAAGALAGPMFGRELFARVQHAGVVPDVLALRQGILPMVVGAVAALLPVRVSAGLAARRAARARLHEALGEVEAASGELGPVRLILAAVAAAGAVSCGAITLFMPPANAAATGGGTALGGAIACALVAPKLTERLAQALSGLTARLAGVPGELAILNVRARAHRTAALVIPVIVVVSIALANIYQQTTQANAMRSAYVGSLRADAVVTSSTGAIPERAVELARAAGSASSLTTSAGWIEHPVDRSHRIDPWPLLGVDAPALATDVEGGSVDGLRGNAVALPAGVADDLQVRVGDTIGMVLGDGAHVRLRVAALLGGSSRYASIVLPPALLAAHTTERRPAQLLVNGDDGVRERVARALAGDPTLTVRGGDAVADDFDTGLQVDAWITYAVVAVFVAFAAMSLTNVLVAALAGRRRELALLRLAGATRRQIRRMLEAEALVVAAVGAIAGTVVAVAGLVPLSIATAGSPLPSGPLSVFLGVLALVIALVLIPTLLLSPRRLKVTDVETL